MLFKSNSELKQLTRAERIKYFKHFGLEALKNGFNSGFTGKVYNDFLVVYLDKKGKEFEV